LEVLSSAYEPVKNQIKPFKPHKGRKNIEEF